MLKYYKLYYAGWEDDTNTSVGGSGDYLKFLTATEKPTKPDPTEPVDPDPSEPSTPDPTDPVTPPSGGDEGKTDPEPTDPTPTDPTDPAPTDPENQIQGIAQLQSLRILNRQNQISQIPQNPLQRILSPLLLVMRIRQAEEIPLQITAITVLLQVQ